MSVRDSYEFLIERAREKRGIPRKKSRWLALQLLVMCGLLGIGAVFVGVWLISDPRQDPIALERLGTGGVRVIGGVSILVGVMVAQIPFSARRMEDVGLRRLLPIYVPVAIGSVVLGAFEHWTWAMLCFGTGAVATILLVAFHRGGNGDTGRTSPGPPD